MSRTYVHKPPYARATEFEPFHYRWCDHEKKVHWYRSYDWQTRTLGDWVRKDAVPCTLPAEPVRNRDKTRNYARRDCGWGPVHDYRTMRSRCCQWSRHSPCWDCEKYRSLRRSVRRVERDMAILFRKSKPDDRWDIDDVPRVRRY